MHTELQGPNPLGLVAPIKGRDARAVLEISGRWGAARSILSYAFRCAKKVHPKLT